MTAMEPESGFVLVREKPASSRVANLPQLSKLQELKDYLKKNFSSPVATFWYYLTPEELCDIVEKYTDLFQVHWREYSTDISEDMVSVSLFNKGKSGENITFIGLFPFASPAEALNFCRSEHTEPSLWGVEGKFVLHFQGKSGNIIDDNMYAEIYKKAQIDSPMLWVKICERRAKYNLPFSLGTRSPQPSPEPVDRPVIRIPPPLQQTAEPPVKPSFVSRLRSTPIYAVVIEVLAGLFGLPGIGWMIAGKIVTGIILLIAYWVMIIGSLSLINYLLIATDAGLPMGFCCCLPVVPIISGLVLYLRTKQKAVMPVSKKESKPAPSHAPGLQVVFFDSRTEEEKQIEKDATKGKSLGSEADHLVIELIEIGKTDHYLYYLAGQDRSKFDEDMRHIKTREIGRKLYTMGGDNLMQAAYYRVIHKLGPDFGRALERAWGYIGSWLP